MKMGRNISYQLKRAAKNQEIKQTEIARSLNYAQSTVNGYFNGDPAPCEFIDSVAVLLDDSYFNMDMAHEHYGMVPNMETEVYQENAVSLEILQVQQSEERKEKRNQILLILSKNDHYLTECDKQNLEDYANEFLDEILVEMKVVMLILSKCSKSLMTAVRERRPHWIKEGYVRR